MKTPNLECDGELFPPRQNPHHAAVRPALAALGLEAVGFLPNDRLYLLVCKADDAARVRCTAGFGGPTADRKRRRRRAIAGRITA